MSGHACACSDEMLMVVGDDMLMVWWPCRWCHRQAAAHFERFFAGQITAAGRVPPAKASRPPNRTAHHDNSKHNHPNPCPHPVFVWAKASRAETAVALNNHCPPPCAGFRACPPSSLCVDP